MVDRGCDPFPGEGILTFFPVGNDAFVANTEPGELTFHRDSAGRVTAVTLTTGGVQRRAAALARRN